MTAKTSGRIVPTIRLATMADLARTKAFWVEQMEWDGEALVLRYDRQSGAVIIIAIHSTRLGPAAGPGIETLGWSEAEAQRQVAIAVRDALHRIFGLSNNEAITTEAAARRMKGYAAR